MTSVQVATKAMAAGEGWDSDGSLSWEDFFGKKMIEHHT
jgi:sugar lactone lactonase YvrE